MNNFEKIKNMSVEELVKFLDEKCIIDNTPWMNWWNNTYCDNCESVIIKEDKVEEVLGFEPFLHEEYECAYCELHDHCRFFPDQEQPYTEDIIRLWMNAEENN